jgi:hypothetical protein
MFAPYHRLLVMLDSRLLALTSAASILQVQLDELNALRERLKKAKLSARRSGPLSRRKITFNNERRHLLARPGG